MQVIRRLLQLVSRGNRPRLGRMRILTAVLLALTTLVPGVWGQILVEVTMDQEQFLPGESLPASVRVTNRSGQALKLGDEADWLTFSIESRDNFIVAKNGEVPVLGEFSLDTAKVATKRVDLAPYFALTRAGRYRVTATVRIKSWGAQSTSPPKDFSIINGAKFWEQDFGVPGTALPGQPPETRRYALLQMTSLRSEIRLYARVSDTSESRVFKVSQLGSMVSFGRPEAQVDARSHLHVLHQNSARTALYSVINPDGEVVVRQFYEFQEARPHLQTDSDGKIFVVGGERRKTENDLPAPTPEDKPAKP